MRKASILSLVAAIIAVLAWCTAAQQQSLTGSDSTPASPTSANTTTATAGVKASSKAASSSKSRSAAIHLEPSVRIEGEKRFHENCSRCHMAPEKLPPRAAATIIRHMRVRATLTDEDMRLILAYIAQ